MPNTTCKLLISDLDGTLLFTEGKERVFRESDIGAIREFQNKGNLLVVNSGRTVSWLTKPLENHIDWDYLIASTGALIIGKRRSGGEIQQGISEANDKAHEAEAYDVIVSHPMEKEHIQNLLDQMEDSSRIVFQTLHQVYSMKPNPAYALAMVPVKDLSEVQEDIFGVSAHFETVEEAGEFVAWLEQQRITSITGYQNKNDVDMVAAGCSKGTGIEELRDYLHIPKENCFAIGDSYNDMEMLKAVQHSYTFHDAVEEVKAHAEHLVDSVAEMIGRI
ncbi:MAG: HAD-IIB family hydrolase [Lachnospiraceae bacterium]|nr:HAD-IIB family hydrolase [Lachnospiraceae bacterium]